MVYVFAPGWAINSHYNATLSTIFSRVSLTAVFFHSGKRAEQAKNCPFQRIFKNMPPYGKDRQRYPLYLTVFWFRLAVHFEKDRQKYRQFICCDWPRLLDALLIPFVIQ
jgi:hypothetical protein